MGVDGFMGRVEVGTASRAGIRSSFCSSQARRCFPAGHKNGKQAISLCLTRGLVPFLQVALAGFGFTGDNTIGELSRPYNP